MRKKTTAILLLVWLLIMVGIGASTLTLFLSRKSDGESHWVSNEEYALIERYKRLDEVRSALENNYYQPVDTDSLMSGAINGMMASLGDRYTFYYTAEQMEKNKRDSSGEYEGLGLLLQNNVQGRIEVLRVYADSPAAASGVKPGDLLLSVNHTPVSGASAQTLKDAIDIMLDAGDAELRLGMDRDGEKMEIRMRSGAVSIANVNYTMLDNNIGYIDIYQFTGNDTSGFSEAVKALKQQNAQALIVDVRNNPGGVLDHVVEIADQLLPECEIVYTEDRAGSRVDYYSDAAYWDIPLAVLVNDMSASASEILAGAIQDNNRGTLLGTSSYGKGIVQTVIVFESDGAGMQYTSACYYTPGGRNIHGVGIEPDIVIPAAGDYNAYSGEPDPQNDTQLSAAIELLKGQLEDATA